MKISDQKINVQIYPTPFKNESRILKITKSLSDAFLFDEILIIAVGEQGLPPQESLDERRRVIRVPKTIGGQKTGTFWKALKTAEWSIRIIGTLRNKRVNCINCHSLPVLPLCVFLKWTHKAKLIYDTHELETESVGAKGIRKVFSKLFERFLIRFVNETIVVNNFIAEWYQKAYRLKRVWVIKNVPYQISSSPLKTHFLRDLIGIHNEEILFLYIGAIGRGRGIELLMDIFSKLQNNKHIVFIGYGDQVEAVKRYTQKCLNVHYLPAVKPEDINKYISGADVGLSLIENICLSYYLCLPNKLFEYISSGLPVIVSNFPVMAQCVDKFQCGWKVPMDEKNIFATLQSIDRDAILEKRLNALKAKKYFGWHLEEPTLLNIYKSLSF